MPPARHPEPPVHAFVHRFRVAADDIDALGHAGNVSWVAWVNGVAEAHSLAAELGPHRYRELGLVWVVRRHEIDYLAEAREGDAIEAFTWVDSWRGATCVRRTLFLRAGGGPVLAHAATTWALLSATTGRPTRIPHDIALRYGMPDP